MNKIKIVDKLNESRDQLFQMISKVIIGQKDVIDHLFMPSSDGLTKDTLPPGMLGIMQLLLKQKSN